MKKHVLAVFAACIGLTACQSTPTPAPLYTPDLGYGDATTLYISAGRASCNSVKPMQCLMVRNDAGENFGVAYDAILGFNPAAQINYTISARPEIDQNNGQATGRWLLDEILSQNVMP